MLEVLDRGLILPAVPQRARPIELRFGRFGRITRLGDDRAPERDRLRFAVVQRVEAGGGGEQQWSGVAELGGGFLEACCGASGVATREREKGATGDRGGVCARASEERERCECLGGGFDLGTQRLARRGEIAVVEREPSERVPRSNPPPRHSQRSRSSLARAQ